MKPKRPVCFSVYFARLVDFPISCRRDYMPENAQRQRGRGVTAIQVTKQNYLGN